MWWLQRDVAERNDKICKKKAENNSQNPTTLTKILTKIEKNPTKLT